MEIEELIWIRKRLEELYTECYIANGWKDKRSYEKKIREACTAISKYAMNLSPEVLGLFDSDSKVALDALNSQFASEDIRPCIIVLEEKIKELDDKKNK